ncbi:hypothetical protein SLS62_006462 [Diatrype stigma]|uniref:Uncharacterized protein n=1 Tax=Diatrype stigma TaxID=117547 RepID=A0AAN9UR14_9PEZI
MSLYCAASVYIYLIKEEQSQQSRQQEPTTTTITSSHNHIAATNLEFITSAMEAIGRSHILTRAFLRQVLLDLEHNGVGPQHQHQHLGTQMSNNIPLLARSRVSRHTAVQPPLPGRLPLGNPVGKIIREESAGVGSGFLGEWSFPGMKTASYGNNSASTSDPAEAVSNKRKRTSANTVTAAMSGNSNSSQLLWGPANQAAPISTATPPTNTIDASNSTQQHPFATDPFIPTGGPAAQTNLPHRTGSPAVIGDPDATGALPAQSTAAIGESPAAPASSLSNARRKKAQAQAQTQTQEQHAHHSGDEQNSHSTTNTNPHDDHNNNRSSRSSNKDDGNKPGVSINTTLFQRFGPRPFATRGRGAGAVSARRGNLGSWDTASLCMYTQFLHNMTGGSPATAADNNDNDNENDDSPWSLEADAAAAQIDWGLFATTGGGVDLGCLGYGSGKGSGEGEGGGGDDGGGR